MAALRELHLFEEYRAHLTDSIAPTVLGTTAAIWVPLEIASAHYEACSALNLGPSMQVEVGRLAGKKACGAMLGTAVRLSRFAGATPWTLMKGADRIWNRAYEGGGMRITKLGDTDARVEAHGNPLFTQLLFCRNSFRGFCLALYGLLSEHMTLREIRTNSNQSDFRVFWK